MANSTAAAKQAKLLGKYEEKSKTLIFPYDLLLGESQDKLSMTFFINTIRNGEAKLSFMGGLSPAKNVTIKSDYGEIPVIHTVSRGLQGSKAKVFSNTFVRSDYSVTLPIPKGLNFSTNVQWTNTDLGAAAMAIDQGADFSKQLEDGNGGRLGGQLGLNTVGSIASKFANGKIKGVELVNLATATVANDYAETLFKKVDNRSFSWSWTLTPRNAKEVEALDNILRLLRFHQLPEFKENVGNGNAFLLYPSSFDIVFWLDGKPNRYIPRISTCALTNITTDFTPNGFMTRTQDGSPSSYNLTLSFAELTTMHKGLVGDPNETNTSF